MNYKPVLENVLSEIKPTPKQQKDVALAIKEFLARINKNLKGAKAILGGSGAKGTWLKPGFDVDIFVQFEYKKFVSKNQELSGLLESAIKKSFKQYTRIHGSRDYFRTNYKGLTFELVPILKINRASDAINIMDISPLHAVWVKRKAGKNADEIRLTKAFCKANSAYGAESHINGFSGYVCEILTIHYGGFIKLLTAARKWKPGTVIDTARLLKGKRPERVLNIDKLRSPLIIIDPVQKERNAAAALAPEKFEAMRLAAAEFLKKPRAELFTKKIVTINSLQRKGRIILRVSILPAKEDISSCKALKAVDYIRESLAKHDFTVIGRGSAFQPDTLMWIDIKESELTAEKELAGPPVDAGSHCDAFQAKHNKTFMRNKRLYAVEKREYRRPTELIKRLLSDSFVTSRVKSIEMV